MLAVPAAGPAIPSQRESNRRIERSFLSVRSAAARPNLPRRPAMTEHSDHIASIKPVDPSQSGNVLGVLGLLVMAVGLVAFQAGWVLMMFVGLMAIQVSGLLAFALLSFSAAWLVLQFVLVFMYPEWPLNRVLAARLRESVKLRDLPLVPADQRGSRVVELVPRDRWRRLALETATDLMLIHVDQFGVWMTGDRHEYSLPADSILAAELESIKPSGWFTQTHMVVLYVRTGDGPIELPIAYRDHDLGGLSSNRRRGEAMELLERIQRIARGSYYEPPIAPDTGQIRTASRWSNNPFEAPAITEAIDRS